MAVAALVATSGGRAAPAASAAKPIVIGWAYDKSGQMAPFDNPALAAAKIRVKQLNARGGAAGHKFVIKTCDTQNNNAAKAKSCALNLLGQGASIIFTTCDVDYATPVVQEAIKRGKLAISTCIGTDQMGPKRFGKQGKLAFSFGNVAQDEGSAMAEYAYKRGWKTAGLATNTLLVYFKNVVQAFDKRFRSSAARSSTARATRPVRTTSTRRSPGSTAHKADVIRDLDGVRRAAGVRLRAALARNKTPILNSWAGDGTYWLHEEPEGDELLLRHVRLGLRRRPEQGRQEADRGDEEGRRDPVHRRLPRRRRTIDGARRSRSSARTARLKGSVLAAQLEKFKNVPTCSAARSASRRSCTRSSAAATA